jgi:hypothetical protein
VVKANRLQDLVELGTLTPAAARFVDACVVSASFPAMLRPLREEEVCRCLVGLGPEPRAIGLALCISSAAHSVSLARASMWPCPSPRSSTGCVTRVAMPQAKAS